MKKTGKILILVLVLAVIALVLSLENRKSTLEKDISAFAIDDTATVTKIFMADRTGDEVLLEKVGSGYWELNDTLKARKEGVEDLINTMSKLAIRAPVSKSSYNNVIKQLASSAVKVEIYQIKPRINLFDLVKLFPRETLTKTYYVGHPTPDNLGTFMLIEGSEVPFVVSQPGFRGYVAARFSPRVNDWRDHTIFSKRPEQIKSIEIEFPAQPEESFRIEKTGENRVRLIQTATNTVMDGFDTTRVIEFINAFRNIRFEAVLDAADKQLIDSIVSTRPAHIITLSDTSDKRKTVKTFRRPNTAQQTNLEGELLPWDTNRLYALLSEDQELVLIQYFVFDPITRPLSYLLGRNPDY